ncbi:hypothetical protein ABT187_48585 [Streptomyces sp. NPDC001817]|uniref:hypothetical protein n=1 Tax=Streptomyces sp. NPDC001817 TaxID=3154398 RepID=UPI00332F960B
MQSSHAPAAVSSAFDGPNLIAYGGLRPVVRLAERCGLPALADEHIYLPRSKEGTGAFPAAKLMSLVGGMAADADSIEAMELCAVLCLTAPTSPRSCRAAAVPGRAGSGWRCGWSRRGSPSSSPTARGARSCGGC